MKKPVLLIIAVLFTLTLYSQGYQFKITDQFELTDRDLSYLAYKDDKLYSYDSTENKIYIIDTNGIIVDSLSLNFKANGLDVYNDTIYVQSNVLVNKKATIFKTNRQNGEALDSFVWSPGENVDNASLLCVSDNYLISYIFAGWSSRIVLIDRIGTVINYALTPGLGDPVDLSFISSNKFCLITNRGIEKSGYYCEYEINNSEINFVQTSEIQVIDPQGVAFVNDSVFYMYSGNENRIYKLTIDRTITSIDESDGINIDVIIYPNLTQNNFRIKSDIEITKIEILKFNGEKMGFHQSNDLISFQHFPKGIYFVIISTGQNNITRKLIIN